jgi:hypothetical protein
VGVPKLPKLGLPGLWGPITLCVVIGLRWGLKQSCSPCWDLSNDVSHTNYKQRNWVNPQLLVIVDQIANLTPIPSFGHNLCFRCPNGRCKPILNIYVPRAFQWYKELFKPLNFYPYNFPLKIWESTRTPSPKVGVALGVWGFIPSHFSHSWEHVMWFLGFPLGPQPCKPFALITSPRLGLQQKI